MEECSYEECSVEECSVEECSVEKCSVEDCSVEVFGVTLVRGGRVCAVGKLQTTALRRASTNSSDVTLACADRLPRRTH